MEQLSKTFFGFTLMLALGLNVGCGKVDFGPNNDDAGTADLNQEIDPDTVAISTKHSGYKPKKRRDCKQTNENCFKETFEQPGSSSAVDVLFVVQTSENMADEIQEVVSGISSFLGTIPADSDINIGVMLSHGSTSNLSGRLYQAAAEPIVLKSSELSNTDLQTYLTAKLSNLVVDPDSGGGEEGMFTLFNAITTPSLLAEAQSQDFFRTEAALAVVFIADRRDICAVVPPGVPAETDPVKIDARIRDCEGLTAAGLTSRLALLKGSLAVDVSGIIYADSPAPAGNEIGYGITDMIALNTGVAIDIANDDIADGLSFILDLIGDPGQTQNEFTLAHDNIDPNKIQVTVNGQAVPFELVGNKVIIKSEVPAGATVVIKYCLKKKPKCSGHRHGHHKCRKYKKPKMYNHHPGKYHDHNHGHSNNHDHNHNYGH